MPGRNTNPGHQSVKCMVTSQVSHSCCVHDTGKEESKNGCLCWVQKWTWVLYLLWVVFVVVVINIILIINIKRCLRNMQSMKTYAQSMRVGRSEGVGLANKEKLVFYYKLYKTTNAFWTVCKYHKHNNQCYGSLSVSGQSSVAFDKGQTCGHTMLVIYIVFTKKVQQEDFLFVHSFVEESPGDNCVANQAEGITKHDLQRKQSWSAIIDYY